MIKVSGGILEGWAMPAMNFGHDLGLPLVGYELSLAKGDVVGVLDDFLIEVREDAGNFPEDWGKLGECILGMGQVSFVALEALDFAVAEEFVSEFAFDLLNKVAPCGVEESEFVLNTVEEVELSEESVRVRGKGVFKGGH